MKSKHPSSFNLFNWINSKLKCGHIDCQKIPPFQILKDTIKAKSCFGLKFKDIQPGWIEHIRIILKLNLRSIILGLSTHQLNVILTWDTDSNWNQ
jgi:hypothetical protein